MSKGRNDAGETLLADYLNTVSEDLSNAAAKLYKAYSEVAEVSFRVQKTMEDFNHDPSEGVADIEIAELKRRIAVLEAAGKSNG